MIINRERFEEWKQERNAALLTGDVEVVKTHLVKWGGYVSDDPEVMAAAMHKAITGLSTLPLEHRKKSKQWLNEHNYQSWDDGELS